jgi:hypothetical protein
MRSGQPRLVALWPRAESPIHTIHNQEVNRMTKASKRARSTQQKTEPKDLAQAYADLEETLGDLARMAELAEYAAMRSGESPDNLDRNGLMLFAVTHLADMIRDLRENYYRIYSTAQE